MYKISFIFFLRLRAFLSLFFSKNKLYFASQTLCFDINIYHAMQKMFIISIICIAFSNQLSKHLYLHTLIKLFIGALIGCEQWLSWIRESAFCPRTVKRVLSIVIKWLIEFEHGFCFAFSDKGTLTPRSAS